MKANIELQADLKSTTISALREAGMRIGEAAARLGIEPHVLRHWEEAGVLVPRRLRSGHRDYDEDSLDRVRLIQVAQGAGMSLAEIRDLAAAGRDQHRAAITAHRDRLRRQMALLQAMDGFLAHVGDCVHPVLSECPECSAFVTYCKSAPSRRYGTPITPLCMAPYEWRDRAANRAKLRVGVVGLLPWTMDALVSDVLWQPGCQIIRQRISTWS